MLCIENQVSFRKCISWTHSNYLTIFVFLFLFCVKCTPRIHFLPNWNLELKERQIAVGANNPFFVDFFVQEMSQTLWEYIWSSNDKHRIYTASKDQRTIESVGQDGRKAEGREEGGGFKVCKGWAEEGERVMLAHLSCVIVFNIRLAKQSSSSNIEHAYTIQMQRKDTLTNNHHPNAQMETSRRGGRCWFWMAGWTRHKTRVLWQLIKLVKAPPWSSIDGTPPAFSTQQQPNGRILQWRWNFHNSK